MAQSVINNLHSHLHSPQQDYRFKESIFRLLFFCDKSVECRAFIKVLHRKVLISTCKVRYRTTKQQHFTYILQSNSKKSPQNEIFC